MTRRCVVSVRNRFFYQITISTLVTPTFVCWTHSSDTPNNYVDECCFIETPGVLGVVGFCLVRAD